MMRLFGFCRVGGQGELGEKGILRLSYTSGCGSQQQDRADKSAPASCTDAECTNPHRSPLSLIQCHDDRCARVERMAVVKTNRLNWLGYGACAMAGCLWGTGFFFGKLALREMSVGHMVLYRFLFASLGMLPIVLTAGRRRGPRWT